MKPNELTSLSVEDLMVPTRKFSPTDRASTLIGHLRETGGYDGFVEENQKTSVITIHDMLGLTELDTKLIKLKHQVPRLSRKDNVGDATSLMFEHRTRSLPIYEGRELLGAVTSSGIVGRILETDVKVRVSSIMTPSPLTLQSTSTMAVARELMRTKGLDQIPIMHKSQLKRVLTSAEIVFSLMPTPDRDQKGAKLKGRYDEEVGMLGDDAMLTNEVTDSLQSIFHNMRTSSKNYSIIMNTGEVQGIITYKDLMKILVNNHDSQSVPMYVVGLPDSISAAIVRAKFLETVNLLTRVFPEITEARAVIESEGNNPQRKKTQVKVIILTPKQRYSYQVTSYDIAESFDQIHVWAKKLISQHKPNPRRKTSGRTLPGQ
jgi:CBS domain-containing protein